MSKKALIVGINYETWTQGKLSGCVNDSYTWKGILQNTFGYNESNILMIVEEPSRGPQGQPTKQNILNGLQWLVQGARAGDKLVFQYSGHGSQVADKTGDEKDGQDECICPVDCRSNGVILDDDLNRILVQGVPAGVLVTVVLDCCHSGSGMDLEFTIKPGSGFSQAVTSTLQDPMAGMQFGGGHPGAAPAPAAMQQPQHPQQQQEGGGGGLGAIMGMLLSCCSSKSSGSKPPSALAAPGGMQGGGAMGMAGALGGLMSPGGGPNLQAIIMGQVASMIANSLPGGFGAMAARLVGGGGGAAAPGAQGGQVASVMGMLGGMGGGQGGALNGLVSKMGAMGGPADLTRIPHPNAGRAAALSDVQLQMASSAVAGYGTRAAPGERPKVILYSGCKDEQTSADANFGGKAAGAMTYAFKMTIDCALAAGKAQPHSNILSSLRDFMKQKGFEQIPQLSANFEMDPSREPFEM